MKKEPRNFENYPHTGACIDTYIDLPQQCAETIGSPVCDQTLWHPRSIVRILLLDTGGTTSIFVSTKGGTTS